jgi:uncharacterized protein (TIGR03437 family)
MTTYALPGISRAIGILLALSAAAHAQFTGAPGSPFPAGLSPDFVAVGDFNGDGKPDLAIANMASNNVTVLLGLGTGEFAAAPGSPFPVGSSPDSVAVGDFNGDGTLDLAVANQGDGTVTVLLGDGKGGFTAAGSPLTVGSKPYFLVAADFTGDGNLDLAIASYGDSTITVLLGNGGGGFTAAPGSPFAVGPVGAFPASLAVADFNRDGKPDLAVANFGDDTVSVLLGNGTGAFTPAPGSPFAVGSEPDSVAVGDFNGDSIADLAVVNSGDNTVTVLLGNGAGAFTVGPGPYRVGSGPDSVAVADFNGDGNPDLAVANFVDSTVTVLLGNGTGGFIEAQGSPFGVGTNTEPTSLAVGDFNGDGKPDLAFADSFANNVTVLLDSFTTAVAAPVTLSAASGTAPVAPGSIVSIYGSSLATTGTPATSLPLPISLGGTSVTITDSSGVQTALPLFYAGPTQINAEIPQTASVGAATITIATTANGSQTGSVTLAEIAPGLFSANETGKGVAAAQLVTNATNGTQTTVDIFQCTGAAGTCVAVPLDVSGGNTALVLYGTGIQNRAALSDVTVTIGGQTLPAAYAGAAPNYAGEDQVNVLLPASLAGSGTVNVSVTVSSIASNVVTLSIQ